MYVGGEGGDNDPLPAPVEEPVKGLAHDGLAHGVPWPLHIGGVRQQGQYALLPQLAEAPQVDHVPVDGRGVNLEVPGVDDHAHAGVDGEGHRVGDGVVHMDELHIELPGPDHLPGLHGNQLGLLEQAVLLQLELDQPGCKSGAVNGHVHLPEHIGDGADVVLVPVGDEEPPDPPLVFHQIGHIGDHQIDPVHVPVREAHAAVDDDHLAAVLIDRHVLSDLIETAEGNNFHFFCQNRSLLFVENSQNPAVKSATQ